MYTCILNEIHGFEYWDFIHVVYDFKKKKKSYLKNKRKTELIPMFGGDRAKKKINFTKSLI